jgi:flavin reductase (DIM6/NTAB) family NADH-FMN oxidoreductase RutF
MKDTAANIREAGAFAVNLVDEALADQMNICAIDFPASESEIDAAGLDLVAGTEIAVPHIATAPVVLECRHYMTLEVSRERRLCIGQVVCVHVRDGIVDPENLRVDIDAYRPVARLYGNYYARLGEVFQLVRRSYSEWKAGAARSE